MQPLLVAADADGSPEKLAEAGLGEEFGARAVGDDAAGAHEDDPFDLGQNVGKVMGDEDEAGAFGDETAQGLAEIALCGEIESVGGLVEQELAGAVHEGAGDEDAAFFSGGHFTNQLIGEMGGLHAREGFHGTLAHFIRDMQIGPEG